jgi:Domain of unknown function (DUF4340)
VTAHARSLLLVLLAAALALALGLYAYFGVLRHEEKAQAEKEAKEKLVAPVSAKDGGTEVIRYDRLSVTSGGETTELGRLQDGSWVISAPFRTRADPRAAEDVISALQALRLTRIIDEQPKDEDLERYGLKPPRFSVTATAEGAPPLTVLGGVENTFDGSVYVQRAADARVYAVEGFARTSLDKTTDALRARDVLGARDLGLLGLQLKSANHDWAAAREPEKPWAFQKPAGQPADGAAISQWVAGLAQQRASKFLTDSPAERKRTLVEKPAVDASFRRMEETVRVRLAVGPLEADPAYVLREDAFGTTLAEVPRSALASLDVPAAELRDRRVLNFDPSRVERIRFLPEGGGPTFVVQRNRTDAGALPGWLLVSRTPQPASTAKVGSLLYALSSLKWLPLEEAPPKDPGLGATARTILLEDAQGQVLGTLVLGKTAYRKDKTVWTRSVSGEVVQVDLGRLTALPAQPEDLTDIGAINVPIPGAADAAH